MALDLDHVREIVERVARDLGLEVVEVEFRGGGKSRMLRIFIDKREGVTHADCEAVSREASTILDVEDAVPGGSYTLEVSSPGLDRKLYGPKDYERFVGSLVKLQTREPVNGNRFFQGRLRHFAAGKVTLQLETARKAGGKKKKKQQAEEPLSPPLEIDLGNIEKANLVPEI